MSRVPRFAFRVFGCRLNQAEAAGWREQLLAWGAQEAPNEQADVLFVHTCAVTAPAAHEAETFVRAFRAKHPAARVVLSGCAAELLSPTLADEVIPHRQKADWVPLAQTCLSDWGFSPTGFEPSGGHSLPRARATLIVQDGCDRFCAYCIVPHLRGAPTSAPMAALLRQAANLFATGFREIVLTGCHLALYRDPESGAGFVELLRRLCDVPGEGRFRIGSLEPCVADDQALVRLIAQSGGRLCPFLHLPMQSASDAVLARMGRPYRQADLRRLLDFICAELPLCGLGADWIAGLPGETEADAEATRALVSAYPFTGAHVFPYSRRPGTPAADFPGQVPQHLIRLRAAALSETAAQTRAAALPRFLGQSLTVIPERMRNGFWEGWCEYRIRCRLPGPAERRSLTPFRPGALEGDLLVAAPAALPNQAPESLPHGSPTSGTRSVSHRETP